MEGESTGRDDSNLGTRLGDAETEYSRNSLESTRVTLVKPPRNGG